MTEIVSTYRLQLHKGFTFRDATAIVPYLHELGITHVYCSPYLKAVAGSTHGYDVIDHSQLNPEIGSTADYLEFTAALLARGMSHILDTVPNHMGIETDANRWWNDVLAHGPAGEHGNYFDIDWKGSPARPELAGKVLLPVLGETYEKALSGGSLKIVTQGESKFIDYHGRQFPVDPATELDLDLHQVLEQQHYRLAYWKVAADEINYRRFFDISSLAAVQMDRQEVFDAAHDFTFGLIAHGHVAGLRVDHPDGLQDPKEYFDRLQTKFKADCPQQAAAGQSLFVSVEKILNGDETLREDWDVAGTSGYDFLCAVNDLFVDSSNEPAITQIYARFVGDATTYSDWVYREKCLVLDTAMYSEMVSLTARLDALAQSAVSSRDFTRHQLHEALRAVIGCFPVYRTYVSRDGVQQADIDVVKAAIGQASERHAGLDPAILEFIRDSLLQRYPVPEESRPGQLEFARRFQQLTSPVNAKGIEDSSFYIYNRLASLNEVGGDPGRFGRSPGAIHHYFAHRQSRWPASLSALSTHDTKRSEDVRARINVLSEIPSEWAERLECWKQINAAEMAGIHPNDQYLLYQTLLGAWPLDPMDDSGRRLFVQRITAYMQKALREAKLRSSWVAANIDYEKLVGEVVKSLVDPQDGAEFLSEFLPFQNRVSRLGLYNSISQTVLRLAAPGVCDTYQGTELPDFSLVDPDNRRPVDYERRRSLLASMASETEPARSGVTADDKFRAITRLLRCRRASPDLFLRGRYTPLKPAGELADHVFSFARELGDQCVIVVVPRLLASVIGDDNWSADRWAKTSINLPGACSGMRLGNVITGDQAGVAGASLSSSIAFAKFPAAVLMAEI